MKRQGDNYRKFREDLDKKYKMKMVVPGSGPTVVKLGRNRLLVGKSYQKSKRKGVGWSIPESQVAEVRSTS